MSMSGTLRVACRGALPVLALFFLIGLAGCSACHERCIRAPDDIAFDVLLASETGNVPVPRSTSLVFDARPGFYHAEEFASRSDWPSTESFYSRGEAVFYRERFYGYEGRDFGRSNPTYRRVDAVTIGAGYRP